MNSSRSLLPQAMIELLFITATAEVLATRDFAQRSLRQLLRSLPDSLLIAVDGRVLDQCSAESWEVLKEFSQRGGLVSTPYYAPLCSWVPPDSIERQLLQSIAAFNAHGISPRGILLDYQFAARCSAAYTQTMELPPIVCSAPIEGWFRMHQLRGYFVSQPTPAHALGALYAANTAALRLPPLTTPSTVLNDTPDHQPEVLPLLDTPPRIIELQTALRAFSQPQQAQSTYAANQTRFAECMLDFSRAQRYVADELDAARWQTTQVLRAQVTLDSLQHPEVTPDIGWVEVRVDSSVETAAPVEITAPRVIDTPFSRLYFTEGALSRFEYKPRKLAFIDATRSGFGLAWKQAADYSLATSRLIRRSPDLAVVRSDYSAPMSPQLTMLLQVKAGLGGHLPNSSYGCSIEFWLDAQPKCDSDLQLTLAVQIPSYEAQAASVRALLPVGAVADEATLLEHATTLVGGASGLFGLRLVDGIDHWVVDFRCTKQLRRASVTPVYTSDGRFDYFLLGINISPQQVVGDHAAATLFVSFA